MARTPSSYISLLSGPPSAWSAENIRQPVQRSPAPRPVMKKTASWQPVAPHTSRFEQNNTRLRALVQEIDSRMDITSLARSYKGQRDRMAKLQMILNDLMEALRELLREIAAVSSLMREASMTDQSRSIDQNTGNQLVSGLERKLSTLERKKAELLEKIKMVETEMATMTDMSQQLQLQLQDAMNKSQQAMQILSNIMKNQHDTLKAIIQNMR